MAVQPPVPSVPAMASIVSGAALPELRPGDGEDFALARVKGAIPIEPAAADLANISRQVIAELGAVAQVHL